MPLADAARGLVLPGLLRIADLGFDRRSSDSFCFGTFKQPSRKLPAACGQSGVGGCEETASCAVAPFGVFQGEARAYARSLADVVVPVLQTRLLPAAVLVLHPLIKLPASGRAVSGVSIISIYLWLFWAILHLGRNFSILPEVRVVARNGPLVEDAWIYGALYTKPFQHRVLPVVEKIEA